MKGTFRRVGMTAVPAGNEAREALMAIRDGAKFMADFRGARNPEQHELFWTLCTIVGEAVDEPKDNVKRWLLHKLGYVETWFDLDGRMHVETKSIAWESMEQAEFNRFFQAAIPLMAEKLDCAPRHVLDRFNELVDPPHRRAA